MLKHTDNIAELNERNPLFIKIIQTSLSNSAKDCIFCRLPDNESAVLLATYDLDLLVCVFTLFYPYTRA